MVAEVNLSSSCFREQDHSGRIIVTRRGRRGAFDGDESYTWVWHASLRQDYLSRFRVLCKLHEPVPLP
jgi:hypothetical protein